MNPTTQGKSQLIRLLDVFVIGPLMVYGGVNLAGKSPVLGLALGVFGASTVYFNGRNWLALRGTPEVPLAAPVPTAPPVIDLGRVGVR